MQFQSIDQAAFYSYNEIKWSAGMGPEQDWTSHIGAADLLIHFIILPCLISTT